MRVLLLSAYDAESHRRWREGLVRHLPDLSWTVLALPPRHFAWRSRGNALTWALGSAQTLAEPFDLVLATSMTDLAALRGMAPRLASVPTIAYFHENQFAYPERLSRREGQNYMLTNLYTALAADRAVFNSAFNRDTMLDGVRGLLRLMPDEVPPGVAEVVAGKSLILPVPIEGVCIQERGLSVRTGPLTILWNHRWEHDKAPERFFAALYSLADRGAHFRVCVLGQRFREVPAVFDEAKKRLGERILRWGFVEDEREYRAVLRSCDVAVSTALHDFQGLAVLEAAAAGCVPLVPDRLAYPEFIPEPFRYPSHENDPEAEAAALAARLGAMAADLERVRSAEPPDLSWLSWVKTGPRYREVFKEVGKGGSKT